MTAIAFAASIASASSIELTGTIALADGSRARQASSAKVLIATELGVIEIEVDHDHAPLTAANFLRYVDAGLYDGGRFHRTVRADNQPDDEVRIAVIQGGIDRSRNGERFGAIRLEGTRETGLRHVDGTVSMARGGPDTARSEFFICIGDQPELDEGGARNPDGRGFAAFGRVVRGMEIVRAIHASPANRQGLTPPIEIAQVTRASRVP